MPVRNATLITISEEASLKLQEVLKEEGTPEAFLRISLAPGGRGGVQYMLGLETEAEDEDTIVDTGAVKVLLDSDCAPLMEGTSIDYVETMQRSGFVINNPNFPATGGGCGCGSGGGGCGGGGGGGGGGCGGGGGGCGGQS
ncbi:MAG: iron-sulfur cluster assembly accessory protein [SAR202 cluster bacterium]|nr:iron-sulfur cluster assembly accessory protein [SAR202 cluster bacterium]